MMAFRSGSYAGLCSKSEPQPEEAKSKAQHAASVEHIDFRKAFDFADKCSREGSKSSGKIVAFKPVYVRRPVQSLHSFDVLNTKADATAAELTKKVPPAASRSGSSRKADQLEGAAGELQRVFDQLAAQLEREANELRNDSRERLPPSKPAYLGRADSDCGSSAETRTFNTEADVSRSVIDRQNKQNQNTATSLKPPLNRGPSSPIHAKRRRGSAGECGSPPWTKSVYPSKVSSLSASPVRERFAARKKVDSLESERNPSPRRSLSSSEKDGDADMSSACHRRSSLGRDKDIDVVFQRRSSLERDREYDTSFVYRRQSSLERDRDVDGVAISRRRSASRERAEARLAALQKLSASREKYDDCLPCIQRSLSGEKVNASGSITNVIHKEKEGLSLSADVHSSGPDAPDTGSPGTRFTKKHSKLASYRFEKSPTRDGFDGRDRDLYKSVSTSRVNESSFYDKLEKFGDTRLVRRSSSREQSPSKELSSPRCPGKDDFNPSKWTGSLSLDEQKTKSTEHLSNDRSSLTGICPGRGTGKEVIHQKELVDSVSQEHRTRPPIQNANQDACASDLSVQEIHATPEEPHPSECHSLSAASSPDDDHSNPDDIQAADSVQSESLSSSTDSLVSSEPEAADVKLDFPEALDKVVSRYEMEKKAVQRRQRSTSPMPENRLTVDEKPVFTSAENIHKIQKVKICDFFSDESLHYKKDSVDYKNHHEVHLSSERKKLLFVNPEMPGYVGFANLPNQVHRKSVKKGFEFTLMVVGESGLGKSTLVNSLFMTDLYPERNIPSAGERITKTVSIEAATVEIEERGVRLRLTVVDTPGYGDAVNSTDCFKSIIKYVDDQFEKYLNDESGLNRKNIVDNRVHACFYFINPAGHGLKPLDVSFMRALHHKVNIVPVIAKADTLTKTEVTVLKKKIMDEIEENGINIYMLPDCDSDEDESYKESCEELKAAVPFAVVGSNQVMDVRGHKVRARTYPWGVVEVENPDHCDFIKLRTMFITHMQDLQEVTQEVHYENFRSQRLASGPPKVRASKPHSCGVDSNDSEQARLLEERDRELRRVKEELMRIQEEMMRQQYASGSSGSINDKKPMTSSVTPGLSSKLPSGASSRQNTSTAINGQANGNMAKKAPIVKMNQV